MSWIRKAVNRAVERDNLLLRTIQSYADSVVVHAAGGAKILNDRIGFRNVQGFESTVRRLEQESVSCRGSERVELLRRWLVSLQQAKNDPDESSVSSSSVHYVDTPGDEPKNFHHVFLYSQALEGITLSMILDPPNKEEVSLVLQLFGLCLTGEKEAHNTLTRKVQELAKTFSGYQEEVLIKREELIKFAQAAIGGLKINTDLSRIDAELCSTKEKLSQTNVRKKTSNQGPIDFEQALSEIQLCYKLEAMLLKKKSLSNGDSPKIHAEKVDKLKVLLESLSNSTSKAEKRILDHRSQKEDALNFRAAKTNEVHQAEKDLEAEICLLETRRDEIEYELKKINTSLASARKRLNHAREERDQFGEASDQIVIHLKTKEDELLRSVASYRIESEVVGSWIDFLEETWTIQTLFTEQKEKQLMGDLERVGDYFRSLVIHILSTYKENIGQYIIRTRTLVEGLSRMKGSEMQLVEDDKISMKDVEEEYLDVEAKFLTILSIMDSMKKQFYIRTEGIFRKDDEKIVELFEAIEKLKHEFESIERPSLEIETQTERSESSIISSKITKQRHDAEERKTLNDTVSVPTEYGSEFDSDGPSDFVHDINDWEFDALEKD